MPATSDNESSGADIPSRKQLNKAASKQIRAEIDEAAANDDEDDVSADEYVVEKILKHRFERDGTLTMLVKWQGYDNKDDNTWEPEQNLDGCPDELAAYYTEIGGKPQYNKSAKKDDKKRKLSQVATETPSPAAGKGRGAKKPRDMLKDSTPANGGDDMKPPAGSWEDHVLCVETMEKGDDGLLYALLLWKKDQRRTKHTTRVANVKCPQKMLSFYEAHLQFNDMVDPKSLADPSELAERTRALEDTNGNAKSGKDEDDEIDDDEAEFGVKGVATEV